MVIRRKNGGSSSSSQQKSEAVTEVASCRHFRLQRIASHKEGWAACQPVDFSNLKREREALALCFTIYKYLWYSQWFKKEAMKYRIYFRKKNLQKKLKNKKQNVTVQLFETHTNLECLTLQSVLHSWGFIRIRREKGTNIGWIPIVCWKLYEHHFFKILTTTLNINIIIPISKLGKMRLREIIYITCPRPSIKIHVFSTVLCYWKGARGVNTNKYNAQKKCS